MITLNRKCLLVLSLAYIYLPIIIFFVTWTRPLIALVCLEVLLTCLIRYEKKSSGREVPRKCDNNVQISVFMLMLVAVFLIWVGYYAGYGRFVDQVSDWNKHNAVLADLVNRPWPVYYSNGDEHSMLTYYIAGYIVPGMIGKIFDSFRCAEISLYVWNELGLILVFLYVVSFLKARRTVEQLAVAIAIPFFSIPVWLSKLFLKHFAGTDLMSPFWYYNDNAPDGIKIWYFDNFFSLSWVFPQVITIWIMILILIEYKDYIKYYVIVMLPGVMYGTLSFIGLLPLCLGCVLEKFLREKDKGIFRQIFSFENISVALTSGLVFLLYLYGNVTGEKPAEVNFHLMPYRTNTVIVYFMFVFINAVIYAMILFKDHKKDGIYYAGFATLILLPFISMGKWNDLLTRASIPGLFVLMIYVLSFLKQQYTNGIDNFLRSKKVAICLVLSLIGAYYPFFQLSSHAATEDYSKLGHGNGWASLEAFANRKANVPNDFKYNYYSYDLEDNIFYKYIAPDHGD